MNLWRRIDWKWKILGGIVSISCALWLGLGAYAKHGLYVYLRESKANPEYESSVFWWIGPATTTNLRELSTSELTISMRPLDWGGSGQFVTHSAFLSTNSKTLILRLRFNPMDRFFHIVGYANEPK